MERPAVVQPAVNGGVASPAGQAGAAPALSAPAGPPAGEQRSRERAGNVREGIEQTLALSYSSITLMGFYPMSYGAVSASYSLWLPQSIEASIGGRVGF